MNVKTVIGLMCAAGTMSALAAPTNDWENLEVNSINRLPARTYAMPLADEQAALTDALEPETPYALSLNGIWKISWAGNPALRVKDFWKEGYDDSDWLTIDVPSCVELRGFGSPGYTNIRYPHAMKWPQILDRDTLAGDYNPVSSYRRRFTVPAAWKGRDVILRFDGVYSAYYVWVNGRRVGYAEDAKLPSEFDVTSFLREGENELAVEVYRWCDGSYLEDQDMFRYSGIFRDVTLWAKPKDGIWDFVVKTELASDYKSAKLSVAGIDGDWTATLYDAERHPVASLSKASNAASLSDVSLWSAEKPYLYTLVIKKGADIRMKRVGFKEQKIVGNAILVNGRKIKFKGVNRHECSVDNGRTVSMDEMLADIRLMKKYNVNTVRTSHYPNHRSWYDLCDRYGIYLCAEANVEGHEPGYKENGLGAIPAWDHSIVERNERHAVFYRNNPSVTIWSMGNETGHGDCFRHAIAAVKKVDPTRPVHWERGNPDADVDSRMYPTVEWLDGRGKLGDQGKASLKSENGGVGFVDASQTAGKPFFMCEYAHAMGNAIGNFQEYWEVFYKYDSLSGGCIWDWVDQAIWKYTDRVDPKTGRRERYLAYGGDFDEEPNDGPFCVNGVVDPFRNVSAKLVEVGHVHRNLVVQRKDDDGYELWNRFGFTFADEFDGAWELVEDGKVVKSGAFEVPHLQPLSRVEFDLAALGVDTSVFKPGSEYFLNVNFLLKRDELWAKKGWAVARNQVQLAGKPALAKPVDAVKPAVAGDVRTLTVTVGGTKAVFCRKSGTLCELVMGGRTILKDPAPGVVTGPKFTCERAFTDNDRWLRDGNPWGENRKDGSFYSRGLTQLRYHARPLRVEGNRVTAVVEVTGSKSAGFTHKSVWSFAADGAVSVENTVTPHGTMPKALPRVGLSLMLDPALECMRYYGRGPRENYVDRKTGSVVGVWNSTVSEQYEPYVRPQDNGSKSDVRWVEFTDATGRGVRFQASEPMFVRALHYSTEDLENARHRAGQKRMRTPLVARPEVMLDLDIRQLGLGGASCGPRPMAKYIFPIAEEKWTVRMEPVE